jgi:hypothetical protein
MDQRETLVRNALRSGRSLTVPGLLSSMPEALSPDVLDGLVLELLVLTDSYVDVILRALVDAGAPLTNPALAPKDHLALKAMLECGWSPPLGYRVPYPECFEVSVVVDHFKPTHHDIVTCLQTNRLELVKHLNALNPDIHFSWEAVFRDWTNVELETAFLAVLPMVHCALTPALMRKLEKYCEKKYITVHMFKAALSRHMEVERMV